MRIADKRIHSNFRVFLILTDILYNQTLGFLVSGSVGCLDLIFF